MTRHNPEPGMSTEVMQDAARASGFGASRSKGDPEALDWPPRSMKDARTDDLEPPLQILSDRSLLIKQFAQIARHRERASLSILRLPWIEPDFAAPEIDLSPLEWQDLAVDPPPRDVREGRDRAHRLRQSLKH
jgi:hypothetical protein